MQRILVWLFCIALNFVMPLSVMLCTLCVMAADVDEEVVTKPVSRREKKKREVLKVKKQKLKTDLLKKTTCVPSPDCVCCLPH